MNQAQQIALRNHCRLACETALPIFTHRLAGIPASLVLTVNSGYECIEAGFGGPVWHASVAPRGTYRIHPNYLRRTAHNALQGVGDSTLGEWEKQGVVAFHLRRRLSAAETAIVGPAVDARNTRDGLLRAVRVLTALPQFPALRQIVLAELQNS